LTDIDCELIAPKFDSYEYYINMFDLNESEKADVQNKLTNRLAVREILNCWRKHNSSAATFKQLLEILSTLGKQEIAKSVCEHVTENIAAPKPC